MGGNVFFSRTEENPICLLGEMSQSSKVGLVCLWRGALAAGGVSGVFAMCCWSCSARAMCLAALDELQVSCRHTGGAVS